MAKSEQKYEKAAEASQNAPKFKKVRHVTLPQLKIKTGVEYILRIETPFERGKSRGEPQKDAGGNVKEPPFIFQATDMVTGEMFHVVANTGIRNEIEEHYPDAGYVGKIFSITAGEKRVAKNGNNFTPFEIAEVVPE